MALCVSKYPAFSPDTMVRSHPVLHNQDIMKLIGKFVICQSSSVAGGPIIRMPGTHCNSFVSTCRLWRQVYYSKILRSIPTAQWWGLGRLERFLMSKLCIDAYLLVVPNPPPLILLSLQNTILGSIPSRDDLLHFLERMPAESLRGEVVLFRRILMAPTEEVIRQFDPLSLRELSKGPNHVKSWLKAIGELVHSLTLVDGVSVDTIDYLCKKLSQEELDLIYFKLRFDHPTRIHIMFDHMLITRKHFEHYVRAFGRNPEKPNVEPLHMVSSNFESLCQAVLRDNSIDDYLELVKRPFPHHLEQCRQVFLRVGSSHPKFTEELFRCSMGDEGSHHNYHSLIKEFMMMGLVDVCTTIRYKFGFRKPASMTIFEYANFQNHRDLCSFIANQPHFSVRDHLSMVTFALRVNKMRIVKDFLGLYETEADDLEICVALVEDSKKASRRKNKAQFDEVLEQLRVHLFYTGPRKRAKTEDNEDE